jgi:hypothetical protein
MALAGTLANDDDHLYWPRPRSQYIDRHELCTCEMRMKSPTKIDAVIDGDGRPVEITEVIIDISRSRSSNNEYESI